MMKKILVVNVNWLGDVIFSSPVFGALKAAYPGAYVSCLAVPRVKEILECIPCVDEIIIYDEDGRHANPVAKAGLICHLRQQRFDAVFLLHRSLTRALLVWLAGIPQRIGYDTKGRGRFLTHAITPLDEAILHRLDYYAGVVESFGVTVSDRMTRLRVDPAAKAAVERLLAQSSIGPRDFIVVLNPGGNWDLKRWPHKNFRKLLDRLCGEFGQEVKIILTGAPGDAGLAADIIHGHPAHNSRVFNFAGKMDLKQLIALMARAQVAVSADSGPLHIASSVGTDTVGLFGPTRPEVTGPCGGGRSWVLQRDVGCNRRACYYLACPDNSCMQAVHVGDVIDVIRQVKNK